MADEQDEGKISVYDEHGSRVFVIPAEVKGFFRKWRTISQYILILVFLILPWTKINGVQSLLLDIPNRKFAIFGITFWAHDGPLVFFVLATLTLGLMFVTAVWGRVWCGWACPQTVFIDGVYRKIEILIEGNYLARRKLRDAPLGAEKIFKGLAKWISFFLVSSLISHSFAAYFVGAPELIKMIVHGPASNMYTFVVVSFITGTLLLDFGWFREQFCMVMCPYGRFQSVLMDRHSQAVLYDAKRGEPRKGSSEAAAGKQGDCVSCNRCVQVCPTGIDIRNGLQMECIACTACVDACDEIMTRVKKPTGLIRYSSIAQKGVQAFRPRAVMYFILIVLAVSGLTYKVSTRTDFYSLVLRGIDTPYQQVDEGDKKIVINHLKLHLQNQTFNKGQYQISAPAEWEKMGITLTVPNNPIELEGGKVATVHFFVKFPPEVTAQTGQFVTKIVITDNYQQEKISRQENELKLVGPMMK